MRRNWVFGRLLLLFLVALMAGGSLGLSAAIAADAIAAEQAEKSETADGPALVGHDDGDGHKADGHATDGHATDGHGDGGKVNPLVFDPDLAIFTAIVFGCLVFMLGKFAWPTISSALLEREKRIEGNIADAEAMNAEAKNMLAQHEAKLAMAAAEVRELLDEARRDAEHTKTQIIAEAKQLAGQERDRAVREVDLAAESAMHKLAETSANMAVDLAGQVVKQNITPDQQASLVREALAKLASSSPSEN